MSTVLAVSLTMCISFACSVTFVTWPIGVLNNLPDAIPVGMNGSSILPQLDIVTQLATMDGFFPFKTPLLIYCMFLSFSSLVIATSFLLCTYNCQVFLVCHPPQGTWLIFTSHFFVMVNAIYLLWVINLSGEQGPVVRIYVLSISYFSNLCFVLVPVVLSACCLP